MKSKNITILSASILLTQIASANSYNWTNLVENGSLGLGNGHSLSASGNWAGGSAPTFNNQAELIFTGLGTGGASTTIFAGAGTTTLNRLTTSTQQLLRFNSGSSTLSFQGGTPTIDHQAGNLRLEVILSSSAGITKTGAGTVFSNLQSTSSGFTGPLTIAQGIWTSGNNSALGDQKTVNIQAGGSANMNGQLWGSASLVGGTTVARNYTFNIAGTGTNGEGAITNTHTSVSTTTGISGIRNLNLDGNASVGGSGDYNIGHGGTINGKGHTLTKSGSNSIWLSGNASNISYQVDTGSLVGFNTDNAFGGAEGAVSVANGATLASSGARSFANSITLAGGAILNNLSSNTTTWSGNVSLTGGQAIVTGVNSSANITLSGLVSGDGGITKQSANTLLLNNQHNYSGQTLIEAGQIRLGASGSIANSSGIKVSNGASFHVADVTGGYTLSENQTLSGGGTIIGNATISGTHSPGFSPGIQTFQNNVSYTVGSDLVWELVGNTTAGRGTNYDGINVGGDLTFSALTTINLNFALAESTVDWTDAFWSEVHANASGWKIFDVDGSITGLENVVLAGDLRDSNGQTLNSVRGSSFFHLYQGDDGVYLSYLIPEPSTALLGVFGMLTLLRRRRP
jgi:autotransporter-associated beta strand protein